MQFTIMVETENRAKGGKNKSFCLKGLICNPLYSDVLQWTGKAGKAGEVLC